MFDFFAKFRISVVDLMIFFRQNCRLFFLSIPVLFFVVSTKMSSDSDQKPSTNEESKEYPKEFPKTLEEFGYKFNERGQLRQIDNPDEGFVFELKPGDKNYNQKRYEALGEILTEEIYNLLETKTGLKKIYIPTDATKDEPRGFFFASNDAFTNERLMILIHGSGVVRAGQWARKLLINEDINSGSQIPYILDALESGFGVVVLNTNQNRAQKEDGGKEVYIRESEDPISHALYVWDNFIHDSPARHIAIVAHSAGGHVTGVLAHERSEDFIERVFAVAFTDSCHSPKPASPSWDHMTEIARNWVTSEEDVGKPVKRRLNDVDRVSAGTLSHEKTSSSAINDVRRFIKHRYESVVSKSSEKLPEISEEEDAKEAADESEAMNTSQPDEALNTSQPEADAPPIDQGHGDSPLKMDQNDTNNVSFVDDKAEAQKTEL